MKSKLWSVARPALILMLITAVSAAALAGVNALTAGIDHKSACDMRVIYLYCQRLLLRHDMHR